MSNAKKYLIAGTVLFLLGLINGVLVQEFHNPRMGLSAHLAAVQNALVLWALGCFWSHVRLSHRFEITTVCLAIYGMYAIWVALALAAISGASRSLPLAGAGYGASAGMETLVDGVLYSGSIASIVATIAVLLGLVKRQAS